MLKIDFASFLDAMQNAERLIPLCLRILGFFLNEVKNGFWTPPPPLAFLLSVVQGRLQGGGRLGATPPPWSFQVFIYIIAEIATFEIHKNHESRNHKLNTDFLLNSALLPGQILYPPLVRFKEELINSGFDV